jgi:hypothetical protein
MNGNNVWVAFSTGSQFAQSQCWHNNFAWTTETPRVGSFDGDSRADIITFTRNWAQQVYVGLSDGFQSFQVDLWHTNFGQGLNTLHVGDVDGDGLDDLFNFTQGQDVTVWVARNVGGNQGFGAPYLAHPYFAP